MAKNLRIPAKTLSITITEVTEEFLSEDRIKELLSVETSYQIINGYLQTCSYLSIDRILIGLLSLSRNRLIDISLPYFYANSEKKTMKILARYIIFDQKLIGIRVCGNKEWTLGRCDSLPPPNYIQRYYRENRIEFRMDEVLVGSFYLQFKRCKIGLIFQSQILENGAFLDVYKRYKCDILSVTGNLSKQPKQDHFLRLNFKQKELATKLKLIGRNSLATVIYAGLRIVPSLNKYYNDRSYIIQGDNYVMQAKTYLGESSFTTLLCNTDLTLQKKLSEALMDQEQTNIEHLETISSLYINVTLTYLQKLPDKIGNVGNVDKKYFNEIFGETQIMLLYLWYIFKTVNQGSPFVFSFPLTQKCKLLFQDLLKLEEYCIVPLDKLIKVYRSNPEDNRSTMFPLKINSDFNEMIESNSQLFPNLIYAYTNSEEEMRVLRNNIKYGERICYCDPINPKIAEEKQINGEKHQILSDIQKRKVNNACLHVLYERYQTTDEVLTYFREISLTVAEIEYSFVDVLPKKIKRGVKLFPLYLFLLHSGKEKIIYEVGQAELRLNNDGNVKSIHENDKKSENKSEPTFRQKVQIAKNYKNKQKNSVKCHHCDSFFKKNLVFECNHCNQKLCFDCLDILTNKTLIDLNQYSCLICSKRCQCVKCNIPIPQKREVNQAPILPSLVQKDSIFKINMFSCQLCCILDREKKIMIQCNQCKKLLCYSCSQSENEVPLNYLQNAFGLRICKDCKEFNKPKDQIKMVNMLAELPVLEHDHIEVEKEKEPPINVEKKDISTPICKELKKSVSKQARSNSNSSKPQRGNFSPSSSHSKKSSNHERSRNKRRQQKYISPKKITPSKNQTQQRDKFANTQPGLWQINKKPSYNQPNPSPQKKRQSSQPIPPKKPSPTNLVFQPPQNDDAWQDSY